MNSGNKRLIQTIIVSGLSVLIGYLINFFVTPYITSNIGMDAYGFVSIAGTTVNYATIITTALTSFIVRYISISYHEDNLEEANKYYSSSIAASAVLAGIIFVFAACITSKLELFLNIPEELVTSVKTLFVIVYINFFVTTITIPFGASAYIKNRLDITGYAKVAGHLCNVAVLLLLFTLFEPRVWFVTLGTLSVSIISLTVSYIMTKKITPELIFKRTDISLKRIKNMMGNGVWNSLNSLGNVLNSGLDLLIANLMLTGTQTGQIAIAKTIENMFTMLYQLIFQPFQPRLLKAYANGDKQAFVSEVHKCMKISGMCSNIAFAGFFALGHLYFKLWLPEQDYTYLTYLTIITVFGAVTAGIIQPIYYINTLTLHVKLPCILTILSGVLNVVSMYLLLSFTDLGPVAVVGTTVVIMLTMNLTFNPIYSAKCIGVNPMVFYKVMARHFVSTFSMVAVFCGIDIIFAPTTWIGLIFCAFLMCIVGVVIHFIIVYTKKERIAIFCMIRGIFKKNYKNKEQEK